MVRIQDDTELVPIEESPVLRQLGLTGQKVTGSDGRPVKAGEWVKNRIIKNLSTVTQGSEDNTVTDVEVVPGVKMKYFD